MMRPPARWAVAPAPDPGRVDALVQALGIPTPLATLLVSRGHATPEGAGGFLRPALADLSDPYRLRDMDRAVAVLQGAVRDGRAILVHGDYDVDGQCGAALLTRALRAAHARVVPFVPHRVRDGYDFGAAGLAAAAEHQAGVIVTVDCGATALEAVGAAKARGLAVIVTDHHTPGPLPPADAVLNPHRADCPSTFKEYCGAGVAFKLVQALVPALGLPANLPYHLLDLVALATVADIVPLVGENRALVRYGLRTLADSRWPGVRALVEASGLAQRSIRAGQVGFILAPRLNAIGRIGDAMDGLRLLLADDAETARGLATRLESVNAERQRMDQAILEEALEDVEREVDLDRQWGLVLARDGWHPGVIGIVASRVVERFGRPTILVALDGAEGRGSGRSIPRFDLHAALMACAPHLSRFGGHPMAAGLSVSREALPAFRDAFNEVAHQRLEPDDLIPRQRVDLVVRLDQLDLRLERMLRALEPCGSGNPAPVFGAAGVRARDARVVGGRHLRFVLDDGAARLTGIGFDWAERVSGDWNAAPVDIAFRLERDDWQGLESLQARVVHIGPAA
ncbi:MAG TPA: single-stranded-DNA-specific exonuclease RecJ [Gemmatimonadales bacterium]